MERPMQKLNDLSRCLTAFEPDGTLIAVIEMSLSSWLIGGILPGVERQPLKKLAVDESALLKLLHRWREEAEKAGHRIGRIVVAFEGGRDGFWLARWLLCERTNRNRAPHTSTMDAAAKRPNPARESLIGQTSPTANRIKAALIRLGTPGSNPKLKRATARLDGLHTPEGEQIPPNT